jgi:hypothetical protein
MSTLFFQNHENAGMGTQLTSLSGYGKRGKTFPEIGHAMAGQEMSFGGKERTDIQE